MKKHHDLKEMIDYIQEIIDSDQNSCTRFIHVGTLMDILTLLKEQDYTEKAVDIGYLYDWYQTSVTDDPPVWTDEHIKELFGDFYCIPKPEPET